MNLRKVMYVVIVIVCIWSIAIGVYDQVNSKVNKKAGSQNVIKNEVASKTDNDEISQEELKKEFDKNFDNKITLGQYDTSSVKKKNEEEEIVYTYSAQRKTDDYELNINFPIINIEGEAANKFDTDSKQVFIAKGNNIIENSKEQTIYTISYTAYVNEDILSIIIKSTLKEGSNAQRVMVQAYNMNLDTGEEVTLNDLMEIKGINKNEISTKVENTIREAIKEANIIQETGYEIYNRDLNSSIYNINNIDTFFLDCNGDLCMIFAYGNYEFTSELDIVKINTI